MALLASMVIHTNGLEDPAGAHVPHHPKSPVAPESHEHLVAGLPNDADLVRFSPVDSRADAAWPDHDDPPAFELDAPAVGVA
jgi:hypothetical protein